LTPSKTEDIDMPGRPAKSRRLRLEVLETRLVPASFTKTFTANVNIPDGPNGAWVGWDVDARSLPAGSVVNSITVHDKVNARRVGDYQVKLDDDSPATGTWVIRNNVGGNQRNYDETVTDTTVFAGASANQVFHYRIRDTVKGDVGYLDSLQLTIRYTVSAPAFQLVNTTISTTQARDGQTIRLGYEISNNTGAPAAVTLDGSMTDSSGQVLTDPYRTTTITVAPGTNWYYRDFWVNVPPAPSAGAYNVGYTITPAGGAALSASRPGAFTVLPPIDVRVPILMFHHVDNNPEADPSTDGGCYPQDLVADLQTLTANGYTFVTASEVMAMRSGDMAIPAKPVMLTFDDGYVDFLTTALPILQQFNAKATEFIITEMVDPTHLMTWDQLAQVQATGLVDLEAHTVHHPHLTQLSDADLQAELVNSKQALESHLGKEIRVMAYPYGDYDARVEQFAWQDGYGGALKAWGGVEQTSELKYELNRISMLRGTTPAQMLALMGDTTGVVPTSTTATPNTSTTTPNTAATQTTINTQATTVFVAPPDLSSLSPLLKKPAKKPVADLQTQGASVDPLV
jgi:peptidoglycan/xylan/chitin deacetylase (PgdA/CDA1 family)